jgi:hypothetical protein
VVTVWRTHLAISEQHQRWQVSVGQELGGRPAHGVYVHTREQDGHLLRAEGVLQAVEVGAEVSAPLSFVGTKHEQPARREQVGGAFDKGDKPTSTELWSASYV